MLGLAHQAGHELTADAAAAEVLVVNTCAFIDSAKQESIDTILEMAQHKKDGQCRRLIVTGCMAERYRDELRHEIPEIDAVLGTGEVPQIVDAIGDDARLKPRAPSTIPLTFYSGPTHQALAPGTPHAARAAGIQRSAPGSSHQTPAAIAQHPAPGVRPTYLYDADTPRLMA